MASSSYNLKHYIQYIIYGLLMFVNALTDDRWDHIDVKYYIVLIIYPFTLEHDRRIQTEDIRFFVVVLIMLHIKQASPNH